MSEGEKEKVIQNPQNDVKVVKEPENNDSEDHLNQFKEPEAHQSPTSTNTVCFLTSDEPQNPSEPEPEDSSQSSNQQYGCRQWARHEKGHYKAMNEGLVAAITAIIEEHSEDDEDEGEILNAMQPEPEELDNAYELPPNIALIGYTHLDLKMLDKALHGLNAREWQDALEYEVCQLQKLGTCYEFFLFIHLIHVSHTYVLLPLLTCLIICCFPFHTCFIRSFSLFLDTCFMDALPFAYSYSTPPYTQLRFFTYINYYNSRVFFSLLFVQK